MSAPAGTLGVEWVVDADGCDPAALRDEGRVRALLGRLVESAGLRPVGDPLVHVFPGQGGVTALLLLSESHVAVHTFPELGAASVNLYCCCPRPAPDWPALARAAFGAKRTRVRTLDRGVAEGDA